MIAVQNLSLQFSGDFLFEDISFTLKENDRAGLVGKNGAGKSTLLKILYGAIKPDAGNVILPAQNAIGYLPQELYHLKGKTVFEETKTAFSESLKLSKKLNNLHLELETRTDSESESYHNLLNEIHELHHHIEILDITAIDKQIEIVLGGLGFLRSDFNKDVETFSGGWQMRIELAKILLSKPELVLLDEPTNHLDIESIQWLEEYLKNYPGAILIVSHDRTFLDNVTNRTIEIVNQKIYDYAASYSKYVELRKERIDQQQAAQKNQEKYIGHTEQLIEKFRYKASKAKFAQSLINKLDKMEIIEVDDEETSSIHFKFPQALRSGKTVVEAKHLDKSYGHIHVLKNLNFIIERHDKIAFVGRNGEGKSTLSKIIAGIENHKGELQIGHNVSIGYYAQNQADLLSGDKTVFEIIDDAATGELRTRVRNLLGAFLFGGEAAFKKVKVLSGGEKSRLALCKLLLEPVNLLILDEPTNHLDMRAKDVLKNALVNFEGTIILVSHDRDFLKGLSNRVFEFKQHHIKEYTGDIFDFMGSKKIASLREIEIKQKNKTEQKLNVNTKEIFEQKKNRERELKKLQHEIEKAENDITATEKEIATLEHQLKDPAFYARHKNSEEIFLHYEQLKNNLALKMNTWEKLQVKMENLKI